MTGKRPDRHISLGEFRPAPAAFELVNRVLQSGRISYGPMCEQFEQQFADLHQVKYAILTNSGTDALRIALMALKIQWDWKDGDEVIVPAVTFVATVNIVLQCGLTPVLVDVDSVHYHLDPAELHRTFTPRTRAVIPVHLFGQPVDMETIEQEIGNRNIAILCDSCECMFATGNTGKMVGQWGDITAFSTYVAHLIVTGVGGIITTNSTELATLSRSLVNHGRDPAYLNIDDDSGNLAVSLARRRFQFNHIGYSSRVTEMEAALGIAALQNWQENIRTRQRNARILTAQLRDCIALKLPEIRLNTDHVFMMYPVTLLTENKRYLVTWLEQAGIETRDLMPVLSQPCYRQYAFCNRDTYPVAAWLKYSGLYFGCHQYLSEDDMCYVADTIKAYFDQKQ